jgi:hypothetical protein
MIAACSVATFGRLRKAGKISSQLASISFFASLATYAECFRKTKKISRQSAFKPAGAIALSSKFSKT